MRCVAGVNGPQRVFAASQRHHRIRLALAIQHGLRQLTITVHEADHTGGGQAVSAGHGDRDSGLRAPGRFAGFHGECGMGADLSRGGCRQGRQNRKQRCNDIKPQNAAVFSCHVHLFQLLQNDCLRPKNRFVCSPLRRVLLYLAGARIG